MFLVFSRAWDKEIILSIHEERTSDLRITRFNALPLSYRDSVVSEAITKFIYAERVSYMNFEMAVLTIGSVWLSSRASERGIRRSEVRFLVGTQNFFVPTLVTRRKKNLSLLKSVFSEPYSLLKKNSLYIRNHTSTCLNVLKRADLEASPSMLSVTTVLASDLELPGLPTTNNGILSSIHTTIMNTFSLKAVLRAMLSPSFSSFSTAF